MIHDPEDKKLVYLPEDKIMSASGFVNAIKNHWWCVHPTKGLVFWQSQSRKIGEIEGSSPQCNSSESTAKTFAQRLYPWAEVRFYDLVLVRININDYMH